MAKQATPKADKSPYVFQRKKSNVNFNIQDKIPWTEKQMEFLRLAQAKDTKLIFLTGPAGVSKSLISVYCALNALKDKKVSDILYVRSVVESADQKLGFLPGTENEKIRPYTAPLEEKLEELLTAEARRHLKANELVTCVPINYLRGSHYAGKYIIFDEAQNASVKEMTTFVTRIGEYSKVIIAGDEMQSDINGRSSFKEFIPAFDTQEAQEHGIYVFRFGKEDIVRSELVKYIVGVIEEKIQKH